MLRKRNRRRQNPPKRFQESKQQQQQLAPPNQSPILDTYAPKYMSILYSLVLVPPNIFYYISLSRHTRSVKLVKVIRVLVTLIMMLKDNLTK